MLYATISHHSISSARVEKVGTDLDHAKKLADAEFGDGFIDHNIIITDDTGETIARRRIGDDGWGDAD